MSEMKNDFTRLLIFTGLIFLIIFIFSRSPQLSEWYMKTVYPTIANALSSLSSLLPFSIYDISITLAILFILRLIVLAITAKIPFAGFLYSTMLFSIIIVAWFYFAWGISYFREDFYTRSKQEKIEYNSDELKDFAIDFINKANSLYVDFDVMDRYGISKEIESSYRNLHSSLQLQYPNGNRRVKSMIFESLFTKMGISGYFGPFFNEIHVNNYSLNFTYPFTLAHEMAHQFGIAKESEANLYAFIVCSNSSDERVRYSAYVSIINYLLNDVRALLPDEFDLILESINPEIIADLQRNRAHWLSARNETLSNAQNKAYDVYLKSNKISSGRENYSEVVGLLISSYDMF